MIEESKSLSCNIEFITQVHGVKINGLSNINSELSTHFLVYKIENCVNGKYYIGQHKTKNPLDEYLGSGAILKLAKEKYGISAFIKTILYDFDNFEDMNIMEEKLMPLSCTHDYDSMCYNLNAGGNTGEMSDSTKQLLSDACRKAALANHDFLVEHASNRIWISNDELKISKHIKKSKLYIYDMAGGWKLGRFYYNKDNNNLNNDKGTLKHKYRTIYKIFDKYKIFEKYPFITLDNFPYDEIFKIPYGYKTARLVFIEKWILKMYNINVNLVQEIIWVTNGKQNIKVSKFNIPEGFHVGKIKSFKKN